MNILTVPYNSKYFYIRPDTSLNRDSNDYFCLDGIKELAVFHFIYVKFTKAGKAIPSKFARRYYSNIGEGIHLTAPQLINNQHPDSWWLANSLDNSTFLFDNIESNNLSGEELENYYKIIDTAIENASKYVSFRTGDILSIELRMNNIDTNCTEYIFKDKKINIIW